MREYMIYLPDADNSGNNTANARKAWEAAALAQAGGFTRGLPRSGAWKDDNGKVYEDAVWPYYVACSDRVWQKLVAAAFAEFPDQLAIYHAVTSDHAAIADRPPLASVAKLPPPAVIDRRVTA